MFRKGVAINNAIGHFTRRSNRIALQNLALRPLTYASCKNMMSPSMSAPTLPPSSVDSTMKIGTNTTNNNPNHKPMSPQQLETALAHYHATGNVKGAITLVRKAQENNMATLEMYDQLLETLTITPLDIDSCAFVASWFYSPQSTLPHEIKNNLKIWNKVLVLGFRLAPTYRQEDMRVLVETFTTTFDLESMTDSESWGLLLRAYGILDKNARISDLMKKLTTQPQYACLDRSELEQCAALAYASTGSHQQVENLVESLKKDGKLTEKLLQKIARAYGFKGDITRTQHYVDLCNTLYPESGTNTTMQMIAHKTALTNYYLFLIKSRGTKGLPLKPTNPTKLDALHTSWDALITKNEGELDDITQCNIMLEYLTLANRIDHKTYPISKASQLVDEYMPAHGITPNEKTWKTLLLGYAATCEFENDSKQNIRLDKALTVLSRMDEAGFHADQSCFHALFKACRPYLPGKGYLFEHFFLASEMTSALRRRPSLDMRIFELEKIMMTSKIPHDRTTLKLMLTCLGTTGKYNAMWNRWKLLKLSGLQRDMGLYQHIFSLASLDPVQSEYALSVTRNELSREVNHERIPWNTFVAMLDCAVTAQMPDMATMIIDEMRQRGFTSSSSAAETATSSSLPLPPPPSSSSSSSSTTISPTSSSSKSNINSVPKSPADIYVPWLRAYSSIPALTPEVPKLLQEMKSKQIPFNGSIWQIAMSHYLLHDDAGASMQNIQHTFNDFTMQRFEQQGKIPIPVRQSSPIIPFPSGPYSASDMSMINMYMASLLDTQDVSLVFDVLHTLEKEAQVIGLSRETVRGVVKLARQEQSTAELSWLVHQILPRLSSQTAEIKQWIKHLQTSVPK